MRTTRYGTPLPRARSEATVLIVEPTLGYRSDQPASDLALGASPAMENFVPRDGGLEPRPALSQHTATSNPMGVLVTGGKEVQSSLGTRYNLISGTTRFAWYSASSYSPLSYVSSGGYTAVPSIGTTERVDITQIYEATNDEMLAVMSATSSYQTLFTWEVGATTFSSLTQAPRARWVAAFDNFLVAANVRAPSTESKFIQRVQWSDRGNPFNWTTGISGFQDLLDAQGGVTRVMAQESRVVLFFENEIWVQFRDAFPNTFRFQVLDRSVGTPYGMTCTETPKGICFLARDFMVYLLPKEGGPAVKIGQAVFRKIKDTVDEPGYAWGVYDPTTATYQLYYPTGAGTGLPQRAMWLNMETGAWAPQRFDQLDGARNLTIGWNGLLATGAAGQTWSDVSGVYTWANVPGTWGSYGPTNVYGQQVVYTGSSNGTVWYLNSNGTNDDGTGVTCKWRSSALGADDPAHTKLVNGFRLDYDADTASTVSVAVSRDQGETFDSAFTLGLAQAENQSTAQGYPYTGARYPVFEVQSNDRFFRLLRFWLAIRSGGR